ncbi:response regulator [Microvirga sp. BSC39]|uniref:response regulator n=1 Tax=Microvirga sp. BSC39 TaxID=1549810 RepID=UPI0004E876C7|nr:response regulator [Microvirga sp. BSC39]KFG70819.1 response regulator receiver protein [Microvirga sp. BSC39]
MGQDTIDEATVVLLVEDEPLVRMTAADELEEAGFQVLEAANADVAIAVLESRSEEVQVLFTDVDMPGSMDGLELAEQVHRCWPHVLLLISSGYARPHPDEIPDHGRFMPKPYYGPTLVRHITEMMQAQ